MTHVPWHPMDTENSRELQGIESVELVSVGIDIGTTTTQLMFSRMTARRRGGEFSSKFHIEDRETMYVSPIKLTPYTDANADIIDVDQLDTFITESYRDTGYTPDDVDTGAVIITGEASRAENAEPIIELFSERSGNFVCATAGANLESLMAAHGSGAVDLSVDEGLNLLHLDVGGGTTKIAYVVDGFIEETASINAGARLISLDESGRIDRLENAARKAAEAIGIEIERGDELPKQNREAIAKRFAELLFSVVDGNPDELARELMVTELPEIDSFDAVTFSGGGAEYIYDRETENFGDLGPELGDSVRQITTERSYETIELETGIRATAIGSTKQTVQVSGNTITITDETLLPLRNVPMVPFVADPHRSISDMIAAIEEKLDLYDVERIQGPFALGFHLHGSIEYDFLNRIVEASVQGWEKYQCDEPLIMAFETDVAMSVGQLAIERIDAPVISVDGVNLDQFGYLDIGKPVEDTNAVPLTLKSLIFEG